MHMERFWEVPLDRQRVGRKEQERLLCDESFSVAFKKDMGILYTLYRISE